MIRNTILLGAAFLLMCMTAQADSSAAFMKTGGRTSQPIGHYEFCQSYKSECNIRSSDRGPAALTPKIWNLMLQINNQVNTQIQPATDMDIWGKAEVWSYPTSVGDCEDYVLLKRKLLNESGVPISDLLITVVRQMNGEGHAVLTVRTDRGDYVLDNLEPRIKLWNETNYDYLKRQAANNTGAWVSINDERQLLVGSIK
ncbi:transglutaminase-like cysteine peptidase [Phyllobacterium endophyticum]|jgi:predicted transglutaminase-like cysteine proteinase|uniref:Transglutaminase n=1 Tax=Phyllobacterium endophyticum TaxID=1149773 RepID=A0A2P7AV56_9HYPH|nr:transglutaminase-like cysteine peptidase [Phyllobacterium endophyticum]MBB3234595.1 putative transglutaminase-like cysteine proteinase [Phyllobacterium endophyticum]PSH58067.1 transglutaminase [Phyllobacterium endophyticum]TYR38739.1 transglutaminase-like cysteine peptidase [Phyllobacterium endophyticum]